MYVRGKRLQKGSTHSSSTLQQRRTDGRRHTRETTETGACDYTGRSWKGRRNEKIAFPPGFWCVCARGKKILQATPSKLRGEMGMCATAIHVQQQQYYTIRVLVVRTPVSSLSFQVQHTWYIRPGRYAHEPGSSSASCCCNASVG